jgi:hypothetical protein
MATASVRRASRGSSRSRRSGSDRRWDPTLALRLAVGVLFVVIGVGAITGQVALVVGAFAAMVLSLRWQRRAEAKRLHGYRRRRRRYRETRKYR